MTMRWLAGALALGAVLVAGGCATPAEPDPRLQTDVSQYEYLIGPGDSVQIFVWRNPEVSTTVTVRPDGRISTPLVEDVIASGKTPTQLARELEVVLGTYIKDPLVTVIVSGFVSLFDEQIRIVGEAAQPQALQYRRGMTVLDVMIQVGGLTEFANGNRTVLSRVVEGERVESTVRLDDLIRDGDMTANLEMRPGDILIIPESFF
jgi:polysaccharide export outer membrane protein